MPTTIQIGDETVGALARRAVEEGLDPFSPNTPNLVLRIVLGLEESRAAGHIRSPEELDDSVLSNSHSNGIGRSQVSRRTHKRIGPRLLREHGLTAAKGYFSKYGIPYQKPDRFPAVFFDTNGYLIVDSEQSMYSNPEINVGKQINFPGGVSSAKGYIECSHEHT